jgi:hypothetical protein
MTEAFTIADPDLPFRTTMAAGIGREWDRLSRPGTWWSGAARVGVAATARDANAGISDDDHGLDPTIARMVRRIATDAHGIDRADVDALADVDTSTFAYVELVGVVARTTAVDTAVRGIGADPIPFPTPIEGEPSHREVEGAKRRSAHVPTVGAAGAVTALTAVADEAAAQSDLHGALYLSYDEMGDLTIVKDIPRWQMELAATTTSWLNHCVY